MGSRAAMQKLATEIFNHEFDHVAFFVAKLRSLARRPSLSCG